MLDNYEINHYTCAVIPLSAKTSQVIEQSDSYIVNKNTYEIIDNSCRYFGSSYIGRREGTKTLLGLTYKMPIVIEDSQNLIFFPTTSPRLNMSTWISLDNIEKHEKTGKSSKLIFKNGCELDLNISYGSLENQILRATRLESVLRKRKAI